MRPGSDAAIVRVPCEDDKGVIYKYLAFAVDCNGRMGELDAYVGGAMAVAETCRNLVCSGAEPIGLTDCLNFGNPERPEIMQQFSRAVDGIAAACDALVVPIVSGNVSLYNETSRAGTTRAVLPTPGIGGVGLVTDLADVVTQHFKQDGDLIMILGKTAGSPTQSLAGSEWLTRKIGRIAGESPVIDLVLEANVQRLVLSLARSRLLQSAHDVSEGGLAVALAECCVTAPLDRDDRGARVRIEAKSAVEKAAALFGEGPTVIVLSVASANAEKVEAAAKSAGVPISRAGEVGGTELVIECGSETAHLAVSRLRSARESCLDSIVGP